MVKQIIVFYDNPSFQPEIEYTFRVFASVLDVDLVFFQNLETFIAELRNSRNTETLGIVYGRKAPSLAGYPQLHIWPSGFFGQDYMKPASLPIRPIHCFGKGIPVLYCGGNDSSEPWAKQMENTIETNIDLVASSFFMLSRYEEAICTERDHFDRFPASASLAYKEGFLSRPIVNDYIQLLCQWARNLGHSVSQRSLWQGKEFSVCLTHDVDTLRKYSNLAHFRIIISLLVKHCQPFAAWSAAKDWLRIIFGYSQDPYDTFDQILEVQGNINARSTFYFLAQRERGLDPYPRYSIQSRAARDAISRVMAAHGEVGLHASFNSYRDSKMLRAEKEELTSVLHALGYTREELGCRQHYVRWHVQDSWRIQSEVGFMYDSSVFFPEHEGFRCGICWPFTPFDISQRREIPICELPITAMDRTFSHPDYHRVSSKEAVELVCNLVDVVRTHKGVFMLLWHNSHLDEIDLPGWGSAYLQILEYFRRQNALMTNCGTVIELWKQK